MKVIMNFRTSRDFKRRFNRLIMTARPLKQLLKDFAIRNAAAAAMIPISVTFNAPLPEAVL